MPHRCHKKDDPVVPKTGPSRNVYATHRNARETLNTSADAAVALARWLQSLKAGRGLFRLHEMVNRTCSCANPDCAQAGKHPAERWGATATLNPRAVELKFRLHPDAGIGIATGRHLLVLDFDAGRGGLEALTSLDRLLPDLRDAPRVLTGAVGKVRGRHVYLSVEEGVFIASRANALTGFSGVDVRCAGGYVVAPGSPHRSGARYEWERPSASLPPAPEQLVSLLQEREVKRERGGAARKRSGRSHSPLMSGYLQDGIPLDAEGGQRGVICSLARALLELPLNVEEATDRIWHAIEQSEWSREPWTQEQVFEIVADIDRSDRPRLRKQPVRVERRER